MMIDIAFDSKNETLLTWMVLMNKAALGVVLFAFVQGVPILRVR